MTKSYVLSSLWLQFVKIVSLACVLLGSTLAYAAYNSAVILQYHNVSTTTAQSTSVSPAQLKQHLRWLKKNQFLILPLGEVISKLRQQQALPADKVAVITFDDAHVSVCENAWPILAAGNIPFTVFINTSYVQQKFNSQCSWSQLQKMHKSGLMTAGNHSHEHAHLTLSTKKGEAYKAWVTQEILLAEDLIEEHLEVKTTFFAYPYGEYNRKLSSMLTELGYVSFGQHSGAIGYASDFSALPRFPVSGQFAALDTFGVKMLSLPMPVSNIQVPENPIKQTGYNNPPLLTFELLMSLPHAIRCFDANGSQIDVGTKKVDGKDSLRLQAGHALAAGRHRYTCTALSENKQRYYWFSHQWLIE